MKLTNIHEIFSKIEHRMTVGTDPENIQKNCQFIKFQKCNFLSHFLTAAPGSIDSKFCFAIVSPPHMNAPTMVYLLR